MQVDTKNNISDYDLTTHVAQKVKEAKKADAAENQTGQQTPAQVNDETLKKIEELIKEYGTHDTVSMRYDRDIDRVIVTVLSGKTQQVIRQIPSQEFISFLKNFDETLGLMINRRL